MRLASDKELLQALKQDSRQSFTAIYQKYWQVVYNHAYKYTGRSAESKDLVQDLFVKLWEKRKELEINNLEAYLKSAAKYSVYELAKKKYIHVGFYDVMEHLLAGSTSADDVCISKELREAYSALLDSMPEQRKKIFQMRFDQEMTTQHIASQLNIARKTVQNHLIRSFNDIQALLGSLVIYLIFQNFR